MAAAELPFEYFALALEATRGTAVTPPTHYLNMAGMITPEDEWYTPDESRGTLASAYRSRRVRQSAGWSADGPLDVNALPVLANMFVKAVTAPTTPTNGILTRLWTFVPTMTSDDLKSATLFWGDPNAQIFRAAYAMGDTLTISSDASGTDGATMSASGYAQFPTKVSAPTLPAQANGEIVVGGRMQVWLDTSSAIGTTAVTGRVVSATHSIPAGTVRKWLANGPTGNLDFTRVGRTKRRITTTVVMELADMTQYDLYTGDSVAKLRVRHNGPLIESVTPDYYYYVEVDTYGRMRLTNWGDLEGANRTVEFTIDSEYDTTLGADFALRVQNTRTTL
jgi:hypothetical protein